MGERDDWGPIEFEDEVDAAGWVAVPVAVLFAPGLSPAAKAMYAALKWWGWKYHRCPPQDQMAEELGVSRRSVLTWLAELEDRGFIVRRRQGLGQPNRYVIRRCTPDVQNLALPDVQNPAHQMCSPLPIHCAESCASLDVSLDSTDSDSLSDAWFAALGQPSPSRQQRERASRIITDLTAQGYSAEAIQQAIGLAVSRGARGPDLLPLLMGEAAVLASQSTRSRAQMSPGSPAAAPLDQQATEALSGALAAVDALSAPDRAALESRAREHLPPGLSEAGLQRALPGAMARLLADSEDPR